MFDSHISPTRPGDGSTVVSVPMQLPYHRVQSGEEEGSPTYRIDGGLPNDLAYCQATKYAFSNFDALADTSPDDPKAWYMWGCSLNSNMVQNTTIDF